MIANPLSTALDNISAASVLLLIAGLVHAAVARLRVPYITGLVAAGLALGLLAGVLPASLELPRFRLTPDIVFYIILPVLIFEAGINIDPGDLRRELAPVLTLAIPGVVCSSLVICGVLGCLTPLSFLGALLFGAMISATDPVAAISVLAELRAPKRLSVVLEGEGMFNDATAIVGFGVLVSLITGTAGPQDTRFGAIGGFVLVLFGGLIVGAVIGGIMGELLRIERGGEALEVTLSVVTAFSSFAIAHHYLGVSGVLSVLAAGIAFRWRSHVVDPDPSHGHAVRFLWKYAAFLANIVVFLVLGLTQRQLFANMGNYSRPWLILIIPIAATVAGRIVAVQGVLPLASRLFRSSPLGSASRWAIVCSGIRGAVPMALVLSLPADFPHRQGLFDMTLMVTVFTVLVQGSMSRWIMNRLVPTSSAEQE